ncbi:hypothetical protein Pan241w_41530 [Gimesia alba]|uniref:Uncharacterized protein n=1 Tax=Gimesia alba TaxID=2527973 RepID=A0A517RJK8_9PLAN|nr:heparin lyase I family protein [Gimesia alba]QDT44048.1 hypothetical protein Pan241w_41530 [Gimesia alba]
MHTKTIDKRLWDRSEKCGNVTCSGETIIARPHPNGRSEVKIKQNTASGIRRYQYSFRLNGSFSEKATIVLQFHDWWTIPDNINVGTKSFLYLASPPPLAFSVRKNHLVLSHNELLSTPLLDMEHEWLVVEKNKFTHYELFPVSLNEWIDLEISIKWSLHRDGFVECNGRKISNLKTMFNSNPCHLQFGLYLDTRFESNEIREIVL